MAELLEAEAALETELAEITDDQLEADICKESFFEFFCAFWSTIEAVELKLNWHIKYLCDQLQEVYELWERKQAQPDVLINVPLVPARAPRSHSYFPPGCG
jgi:hypothetical protein